MNNTFPQFLIDETTLVFAFRYALGRRSTAPSHVAAQLKTHWPRLNTWTRDQIQREIRRAINMGDAGGACDIETWNEVLSWQAEPPYLWRTSDGERFTRGTDGHYTMDSSQMHSSYHNTYQRMLSYGDAFSDQNPLDKPAKE